MIQIPPVSTNRQLALLHNHIDTAKLLCNSERQCFWVLDLEDRLGYQIACDLQPEKARLDEKKSIITEQGGIASLTMMLSLNKTNEALEIGWKMKPLEDGRHYIIVVSDRGILIGGIAPGMR